MTTRERALEAALRAALPFVERVAATAPTTPSRHQRKAEAERIASATRNALALPPTPQPEPDLFKPKSDEQVFIHSMGKRLRLTAIAVGDEAANRHMAKNTDDAVIACFGPLVLMADRHNNGQRA